MADDTERHVCTKDDPWTPEKGRRSTHPDAVYLHDRDYGDGETTAVYRCPHCRRTFEEELPQ